MNLQAAADGSIEVIIKWKDLPEFESSWKSFETIQEHFPDFHLEDKVKQLGGSIVTWEERKG